MGLKSKIFRIFSSVLFDLITNNNLTWLRYWVMLAIVSLVEMVVDPMVDYFPTYPLAKCVFLIWCMAPNPNNGASFVFTQVVIPLFKKRYMQVPENKISAPTWVNFFRRNKNY